MSIFSKLKIFMSPGEAEARARETRYAIAMISQQEERVSRNASNTHSHAVSPQSSNSMQIMVDNRGLETIRVDNSRLLVLSKPWKTTATFYAYFGPLPPTRLKSLATAFAMAQKSNKSSYTDSFQKFLKDFGDSIDLPYQPSDPRDFHVFSSNFYKLNGLVSLDMLRPGAFIEFDYARPRDVGHSVLVRSKRHYVKLLEIHEDYFVGQAGEVIKSFRRNRVDDSPETMVKVISVRRPGILPTPLEIEIEVIPKGGINDGHAVKFTSLEHGRKAQSRLERVDKS